MYLYLAPVNLRFAVLVHLVSPLKLRTSRHCQLLRVVRGRRVLWGGWPPTSSVSVILWLLRSLRKRQICRNDNLCTPDKRSMSILEIAAGIVKGNTHGRCALFPYHAGFFGDTFTLQTRTTSCTRRAFSFTTTATVLVEYMWILLAATWVVAGNDNGMSRSLNHWWRSTSEFKTS